MSYRVEPDGTRVYDKGLRYTPVPLEQRKYRKRKPDPVPPGWTTWKGDWLPPLDVQPDEIRKMPDTRPDDQIAKHMLGCSCRYCRAGIPRIQRLKREYHLTRG